MPVTPSQPAAPQTVAPQTVAPQAAPRAVARPAAPQVPAGATRSFYAQLQVDLAADGRPAAVRLRRLRSPLRQGSDGSLSGDAVLAAFQAELLPAVAQALAAGEPTWVQGIRLAGADPWTACLLPIAADRLEAVAWATPAAVEPAPAEPEPPVRSAPAGGVGEVFAVAPYGFAICSPDGTTLQANPRLCELLGRGPDQLVGRPVDAWAQREDGTDRPHPAGTRKFLRGDGRTLWLQVSSTPFTDGGQPRVLVSFADVSDHGETVDRLAHNATHDPLTGLPNRRRLLELISSALEDRATGRVSVAYLDLDGFKPVNDTLGHAAGDALLREVARRLGEVIRGGDAVARLGGDEFVILLRKLDSAVEVEVLARRLQAALAAPFPLEGRMVVTGASVGIAHAGPRHTADSLLADADAAMYSAKRSGRGRYVVFDEGLRDDAETRSATDIEVRDALARNQMELYYQPLFGLPDRQLTGIEALLRWRHPTRGLLVPAEFLNTAESAGLGIPLGKFVLERSLRELAQLRRGRKARKDLRVSVNVGAEYLRSPGFSKDVAQQLEATSLPPAMLTLDIAESLLATLDPAALQQLRALRQLGVGIAADDFGIGTSSLAALGRLPVNTIKLDRSLVAGSGHAENIAAVAVVETLAGLGRRLGLGVVAEGVESPAELSAVTRAGCTLAQGAFLGRPVAMAELAAFLR